MEPYFADDELECLRHLMGRIGCSDATITAGPLALIADWRTLVERCERGFETERMDFLQDLAARTMIGRLFERLPRPLQLKLEPLVREADFRYRSLTRRDDTFLLDPRLAARHPPERDFWLYGLPEGVRFR
jgi:hypothetical protein